MEFENMREKAMADIEIRCKRSEAYNDGLKEGFTEGYDKAIKDAQKVIARYNLDEKTGLKPALRFLGNPMRTLIDKVVEECGEVVEAYNDGHAKSHLAEELVDVQEACETALAGLGYHEKERKKLRSMVIKKNDDRGYYKPPMKKEG